MNTIAPLAPEKRPRSINRRLKRGLLIAVSMLAIGAAAFGVVARNHIRSIWSIRRIPNTKMYVMDYYAAYNVEELEKSGTDPDDVEGSLFRALLPDVLVPIAEMISGHKKGDRDWHTSRHSCSSLFVATQEGKMLFGRNFDWSHDPCLVVRTHGSKPSVAVLDLHYLKLDQAKLEKLSIIDRLNLLFAPYLVEDGMNQHGLAVSSMAVEESGVPFDAEKPTVIKALLKRLILDLARTTDEAIALIQRYNVDFAGTPCHFMIADRSGKSVVAEFVDGKLSIVPPTHPWHMATNHQLTGSTELLNCEKCWRYKTATEALSESDATVDSDRLMRVMASISVENWTMWTSVYDLKTGAYQIAYRRQYDDIFNGQLHSVGR